MIGQTISHYRVLEKLGEGGMGVVYKATDIRLGRDVALKFVKAQYSQRWAHEARLVAALNHPHIATLYDVGEHEGSPYMAMEFIQGAPLKGPLPAKTVVEYGIQIADALAAAHAANMVHRDLKPANILVTEKGSVKLLDFGLARLIEESGGVMITQSMTISGTPGYMAPEQLEGIMADARSDIFAFGCVLYELAGGRRAFAGESKIAAITATVSTQPKPLENVPERLDELIQRCLRKDPARRFQSMLEVKIALEDLRALWLDDTVPVLSARFATRRKRPWLARGLAALALIGAVVGLWLLWNRKSFTPERSSGPLEITRLTTEGGLNIDPAISPDGKLLAYASDRAGDANLDIWVKQIGGGDPVRLTKDSADDVEPNFSPDGTRIVFRSARQGGGLYLVPTLGPAGTEQRIVDGGRRPQFSPDGSQIAYWTGPENPVPLRKGTGQMWVFDLATSTVRPLRQDFAAAVDPVWSPDGKSIVFLGLKDPADPPHSFDWWITPLGGGMAVQCHMSRNGIFFPFAWRANRVYLSGQLANWGGRRTGIETIDSLTGRALGEPRRLTAGTTDEDSPSLSKEGHLVFSSLTGNSALYELPLDANRGKVTGAPERLTPDEADNYAQSVSADGKRMIFLSDRTGAFEVWGKDLATGQERALTNGGKEKSSAQITRDGQLLAWKTASIADRAIFATPFAGGAAQQLCADCGAPDAWTPDGKFLLFDQRKSGRLFEGLLQAATAAKSDYLVDSQLGFMVSSISNDGKWIAFAAFRTDRDFTMYVAPFSPDRPPPPSEWIPIPHSEKAAPNPRWSPDASMLYFSSEQDGYSCIWAERLEPATKHPRGEPFAVQHFHAASSKMVAPAFYEPIALAADKIILSLLNRSAGLWMLKLQD